MKVNTQYFIEKSTIKHNGKYDYSDAIVTSSRSKVTIKCSLHDKFVQSAYKHMEGQGCPTCKKRKTTTEFIEQANNIHNYHYNYDKVKYETNRIPVIITCNLHGDFQQTPSNHLKGHGCKECKCLGRYSESWFTENPTKRDKNCLLYIIQLDYDGEKFYKIGITVDNISKRFGKKMVYNIKMIASYNLKLYDAFILEQKILHSTVYRNRWVPKHSFGGEKECFGVNQLSEVLSAITSEIPYIL